LNLKEFGTTINHAISYTGKPAKNIELLTGHCHLNGLLFKTRVGRQSWVWYMQRGN